MIIEDRMYLKCLQKPRCIVSSKPAKRSDPPCRKQGWQDNVVCPQKGNWAFFWTFSFHLCLLSAYFQSWKQNFSLQNHHMMDARQPFCWWMTFTKVSNPFLSFLVDMTIGRLWEMEYGWFCWFSLRIFSQTSLGLKIFSPRHNGVRFFFSILRHEGYFFQCRIFFPRILFACFFSLKISLQDIFRESLITPSKFKWSAPKIHQTFSQLTDSDLQIISKGFWNNRGQNSLEERGGIRFYLPLTGESVRWRHN